MPPNTLKVFFGNRFYWFFQISWKMHFLSFPYCSNIFVCYFSPCDFYWKHYKISVHMILTWCKSKNQVYGGAQNSKSQKKKNVFQKNFLSILVIIHLILFVFIKILWLISANWYLKNNIACELDFQPNAQSMIYTNVV